MMGSPGWAVAWFFIPLANLVMPLMMMRELWRASVNPRDWQAEDAPMLIILWWVLWLASGLSGTVGLQMSMDSDKELVGFADTMFFISDLISIPALLLLAWIVSQIQKKQGPGGSSLAAALNDRFA